MSQNESIEFAFAHRKELPLAAAALVWQRWNQLSSWHDWDQSLSSTEAKSDAIGLGKRFSVVPKMTGKPIPVTVVSSVEGLQFTTASAGPIGLMAFGHTLIIDTVRETATLEHSICAVPADAELFRTRMWNSLKADVAASVDALGNLVAKEQAA
jgi:hypothetical protein